MTRSSRRPRTAGSPLEGDLRRRLAELEAAGRARALRPVEWRRRPLVQREGRVLADFSSNDYLGLAGHPALAAAEAEAAARGAGATASRLVVGTDRACLELEERLAEFAGAEAALLFGSGYLANVGLLSTLAGRDDAVFSDRLNHASIWDGIRLSGARLHRFRHGDAEHLEWPLRRSRERRKLVVTETVFSMDGDLAPLPEICEAASRHGAALVADEAHALGVLGPQGRGHAHALGLAGRVDVTVGTLGKAFGVYGAYAAGSRTLVDYLVAACRPFVYTTALPPAVVGGIAAALRLVQEADAARRALAARAERFRRGIRALGFDVRGATQIVPLVVGDNERTLAFAAELESRGVLGVAIRPPTVPAGSARVRFSLTARHTDEQVDGALAAVGEAAAAAGVPRAGSGAAA